MSIMSRLQVIYQRVIEVYGVMYISLPADDDLVKLPSLISNINDHTSRYVLVQCSNPTTTNPQSLNQLHFH